MKLQAVWEGLQERRGGIVASMSPIPFLSSPEKIWAIYFPVKWFPSFPCQKGCLHWDKHKHHSQFCTSYSWLQLNHSREVYNLTVINRKDVEVHVCWKTAKHKNAWIEEILYFLQEIQISSCMDWDIAVFTGKPLMLLTSNAKTR